MTLRVHAQLPALQRLDVDLLGSCGILRRGAAKHRFYAFNEKPLRERFADEIVGAHLEAEQFVDLLVLRGEEDHRQVGFLPQPPQRLHAVHARHLDVEDGKVRQRGLEAVERRGAVGVGRDAIAFRLESD